VCAVGSAFSVALWIGSSAPATAGVPSQRPTLAPAVAKTFPLGVSGLTTNRDGSHTLWVLNTQKERLVVNNTDVLAVIDVILRSPSGHKLRLRSGQNCSIAPSSDGLAGDTLECLPHLGPDAVAPVATFTSNRRLSGGGGSTIELNSPSSITVAPQIALPASVRTAGAIRRTLESYNTSLGRRSTVVHVTAGKPVENAFTVSVKSVPRGWVTFVVTNRGKTDHAFVMCPNGGLMNMCLATSSGASYAQEYDNTGSLVPGQSGYFTMQFQSPGQYEYLSDIPGQAKKGAKGDLLVTK
jgi:uncharacterized cupredoxin-like copper-binding protein